MRILYLALFCWIVLSQTLSAQTIRGLVLDKVTEVPLTGATVDLPGLETPRGAVTDTAGWFVIKNLSPGRYAVRYATSVTRTNNCPTCWRRPVKTPTCAS